MHRERKFLDLPQRIQCHQTINNGNDRCLRRSRMARSTLISLTTRTLLELLAIFGGKKWKFWFTDSEETVKKYKQEI